MKVYVINTGTELLLGRTVNTHAVTLAQQLFPLGLRIERQITVPDGPAIRDVMEQAIHEADIIFVTGGLGPTTDDITRDTAAELLGLTLREDAAVAEGITTRLRKRGFPLTDRVLRQAMVPEGATVLHNANGTAPGLYLSRRLPDAARNVHLFLMPGPPREFRPMLTESVLPILQKIAPPATAEIRSYRISGVGESVVEAAIGEKILSLGDVELGYCARPGDVEVRLIGSPDRLATAEKIVRCAYPDAIYSTADEEIESVVVRLLKEFHQTLAVAESCTGGALAHRITNVPGASAVFLAGYVTYANAAKTALLGVSGASLAEHGAVSEAVALQMANGALERSGAHHALATTGIAGPDGGSEAKPVGTLFISLASTGAEPRVERRNFTADRETFKQLATQAALDILRKRLVGAD